MRRRLTPALAATAALIGALVFSGCTTPTPSPTPTPTGFASEAEAFAAAEATYREYVDAVNAVDLSDPATFESLFAMTSGEINSSDRETYSGWHADGVTIVGDSLAAEVTPKQWASGEVILSVCYDVSAVDVVDAEGRSMVSPDRPPRQPLLVTISENHVTAIEPDTSVGTC
ncbi:hypothetical protein AB0N73_00700 [Microbacterium sp. NPDC089189]|uniref:hypothetical protein n=1 Tax=Microbacterium sp. NPDC089189 TaxID=3154972 RepID=UPI0034192DCA